MSARVLNPAASIMTEMSRIGSSSNSNNTPPTSLGVSTSGRVQPSRAALAKVRRDLFGPVDHAAARALAEKELRAQAILDTERWGFDFRLELPKNGSSSRFEWEIITSQDHVPEPYAMRGMPYIKRNTPVSPRKQPYSTRSPRLVRISVEDSPTLVPTPVKDIHKAILESERTPPQESRNSSIVALTTPEVVPAIAELSFRSKEKSAKGQSTTNSCSSTPGQTRKQAAITDFMKSRKRAVNGSTTTKTTKSVIVDSPPPSQAKLARKAGQIHS